MPGRPPRFTTGGTVYADDVTIATVAGGGATGQTGAVSASDWAQLRLNIRNVSFTGGTAPTVTPIVQMSADGSTGWADVPAAQASPAPFAGVAAGATGRAIYWGLDRFVRVRWTTTGTPTTVSFTVDGEGV